MAAAHGVLHKSRFDESGGASIKATLILRLYLIGYARTGIQES